MEFRFIALYCIGSKTITKEMAVNELIKLNPEKAQKIINTFKRKNLLQAIVYSYTANWIYKQFNECFAKKNYAAVLYTTYTIFQELVKQIKYQPLLQVKAGTVLYRGVSSDAANNLAVGQMAHWTSFSSTSPESDSPKVFN